MRSFVYKDDEGDLNILIPKALADAMALWDGQDVEFRFDGLEGRNLVVVPKEPYEGN